MPAPSAVALIRDPFRALIVAAIFFAAFATLATLVTVNPASPPLLDGIDRAWRDVVLRVPGWIHDASEALHTIGAGIVMVPVRIAVAIWLLVRRRRYDVAAWLLAWAVADGVAIVLKPVIGRVRPDGSEATSFPSAHAKTAAQVAIGLVLVSTSPFRRRAAWWVLVALWILAMAVSRTVLDEHWVSDVVAGSLLGAACAVGSAGLVQRWRDGRHGAPDRRSS